MLFPEDWKEYEWRGYSLAIPAGGPVFAIEPTERLWRATITAGGTPTIINILRGPYPDDVITVPANSTLVLEPKGMWPLNLLYVGDDTVAFQVETIRRIS